MHLSEFLSSDLIYVLPAPGGALLDRGTSTDCDADAYLASVAAHIKTKGLDAEAAVQFLYIKMGQVANQEHFGQPFDELIIRRLGEWIREFVVSH